MLYVTRLLLHVLQDTLLALLVFLLNTVVSN